MSSLLQDLVRSYSDFNHVEENEFIHLVNRLANRESFYYAHVGTHMTIMK